MIIFSHDITAIGEVISRDPVSPPELARDTPILDIGHPVAIDIFELGGDVSDLVILDSLEGRAGERLHLDEPLHREFRFDHDIGALRVTHLVDIIFDLLYEVGSGEIFHDLLADIEAIHADIHSAGFGDGAIIVEDIDRWEVIFIAEHIVIDVMSGSHLEATGTELHFDILIHDDRHGATYERHDDTLSLEP